MTDSILRVSREMLCNNKSDRVARWERKMSKNKRYLRGEYGVLTWIRVLEFNENRSFVFCEKLRFSANWYLLV